MSDLPPVSSPSPAEISPSASRTKNYALWTDRVIAAIIDLAIVFALAAFLYVAIVVIGGGISSLFSAESKDAAEGLACMTCLAWLMIPPLGYLAVGIYNKVYLVARRGNSIGQAVVKIRVVTPDGTLVPTGTLILRLIVQVGFLLIPIVALLDIFWPLWDECRQTLHDKAVGTYVIKT